MRRSNRYLRARKNRAFPHLYVRWHRGLIGAALRLKRRESLRQS